MLEVNVPRELEGTFEDAFPEEAGAESGDASSEESAVDDERRVGDEPPGAERASSGELLTVYKRLEQQLAEKAGEVDEYRRLLMQMGADTRHLRRQADDESFLKEMREQYGKDPVSATRMMLKKNQQELWEAMEDRITSTLNEHREFKRLLDGFLNEPANSNLRPYEQELEFLIRERGFYPKEAAELLKNIEVKREHSSRLKSAAAREIRNRSAVETDGEVGEPVDKDKEFYRVMKKARTLDDMFAGLRKLKL